MKFNLHKASYALTSATEVRLFDALCHITRVGADRYSCCSLLYHS